MKRKIERLSKRLKRSLIEECQKHVYSFDKPIRYRVNNKEVETYRHLPSQGEANNFLINIFRNKLIDGEITTQQFRSCKGMIREGDDVSREKVLSFLSKLSDGEKLILCYDEFQHTPQMYMRVEETIPIPGTVKCVSIDIEVGDKNK